MVKLRTEAKRDAILEIAAQAFLELGFERTSMSEIASRVGGSKATLYGYFPSKEELFMAVTQRIGGRHVDAALEELNQDAGQTLAKSLQRLAEKLLAFMASPKAVATHRMVLAEAGQSDVGRLFYEAGPRMALARIARFLQSAMDRGDLKRGDPEVAARHLVALIFAESEHGFFMRDYKAAPPAEQRRQVARAVAAFLHGHGA